MFISHTKLWIVTVWQSLDKKAGISSTFVTYSLEESQGGAATSPVITQVLTRSILLDS